MQGGFARPCFGYLLSLKTMLERLPSQANVVA